MMTSLSRQTPRRPFVAALMIVAACGSDGTGPGNRPPPLRIVSGGGLSDTIQTRLTAALVVEVHDSSGGSGAGRIVRFESLPPTNVTVANLASNTYSTFLADSADAEGRATALIALGNIAGTAQLRVSVPEFGIVDTVSYTVLPGNPTKLTITPRDTTVQPGATYTLHASTMDRLNNPVPNEPLTFVGGAGIASVSPSGQVTVGTGFVRGKIAVTWKSGSDTARVSVIQQLPLVGVRLAPTGRVLVLVNTDGSASSDILTSSDQSLSPSSVKSTPNVVYYTGNPGQNAVVSIVTPGGAPHVLVPPGLNLVTTQWPRWSPDGQWVYFIGQRPPGAQAVWRIRPDGTQADSLGLATSFTVYAAPSISPDGRFVAVSDANGVRVIDVSSKAFHVVAAPLGCVQPHYSPDGTRFACLTNNTLTVMNIDGSAQRVVGTTFDDLSGLDWSPDGAWILARSLGAGYEVVNVADSSALPLQTFGSGYTQLSFVR